MSGTDRLTRAAAGSGSRAAAGPAATPPDAATGLGSWLRRPVVLTRLAAASVLANIVIVVTGGAVRLSASGLGCPTWPRCTEGSLVRTRETGAHGWIEFSNRTLTFVLVVVAVATLVVAVRQRRAVWWAVAAFVGIPAQAVVGGISVLTHLNPWVVSLHLLLSMVMIAITMLLWWRVRAEAPQPAAAVDAPVRLLTGIVVAVTAAVLVIGTAVTGSGPHAGAATDNGRVHRNGLDPETVSQLHADAVMVLVGLSIGLLLVLRAVHATHALQRAAALLVAVELAQGLIGFVQYFTSLPSLLVGLHVFGACTVWAAAVLVWLCVVSQRDTVAS
ncbi:MAG: COX15/CtaA family protein [bacterium]